MEHSDDDNSKTKYFSTTEYSGGEMFGYKDAVPEEPKPDYPRPGLVTFFCVIGFIVCAINLVIGLGTLLMMNNSPVKADTDWQTPFLIMSAVSSLAGYIGTWKMKLWGLYMLILIFAVNVIVFFSMEHGSILNLAGSAFVLAILSMSGPKMK